MKSNQQVEFKETEIGRIPKDWNVKKTEEFCFKITDGTHDSPKKKKSGKYLITSRHLNKGYLDFSNAYFISEKDFKEVNKRSKVNQWDVIIGMIGTIGETYLEKNDKIDYAIKNVGLFKSSGNEIIGKWIFYYMQSKQVKEYIRINRSGTTQEYITLGALRRVPISHPKDKSEMIALVGFLDSLQGKIEILREMNKTLETIGQAIFERWFVDFEFPNDEGKPYKSSGGGMVDSELGEIPKNWIICKLGSITERITKGTTPTTIGGRFTDEGINFVKVEAITEEGVFLRDRFNYIDRETNDLLKRSIIKENDLLFSIAGSIGRVAFVLKDILPANTNQAIAIIRSKEKQNSLFIKQYLKSRLFQHYIDERIVQAVQANISLGVISDASVVYPPSVILEKINKMFWPIQNKMKNNQRQIDKLSQIRDSLLPRLMSGRIRLSIG